MMRVLIVHYKLYQYLQNTESMCVQNEMKNLKQIVYKDLGLMLDN